ncbi:MAG: glycosyltransferase [Deltaproteobacteria bacterium]|nr:glycosyltransferase [Deltaproteobacteria bacterium]
MKILFSLDNYDHGTGGAEISMQALAHLLGERGHDVRVLQRGSMVGTYNNGPICVHTYPLPSPGLIRDRNNDTIRWNHAWEQILINFLDKYWADLVVTQTRLLCSTVDIATKRNIPVVVFVRDYSAFCPVDFRFHEALYECNRQCKECLPWRLRLKYSSVRHTLEQYEEGLRKATLLVANSDYMRKVIRRFYNIEAKIVYPAVDLRRYEAEPSKRDSILFVKPQYVKGFPIFAQVATRMPDRRFLIAGKMKRHARMKLPHRKTIEYLGWVKDMKNAYGRARLLIGPSIWPEPFGRVFVEAAASGIPSVASARGGIPEAVGKGGILIDNIFDISCWIEALRQLEDPDIYVTYAENARTHARRFNAEASLMQFIQGVQKVIGLEV